jgi:hypothetical protein
LIPGRSIGIWFINQSLYTIESVPTHTTQGKKGKNKEELVLEILQCFIEVGLKIPNLGEGQTISN